MASILITGATGALGSALVPFYAARAEDEIILLLRARDDAELDKRLKELLAFWGDEVPATHRITAVRGDVSVLGLGLSPADYERVKQSLTHIVHAAASVKMTLTEAEANAMAVTATEEILKLADAAPNFVKLDDVSTLGVAGNRRGLVPEERLPMPGFHNTYESSKYRAEELLWQRLEQRFPLTIHRPSMIVGTAQQGKIIHFQIFYYLVEFLSGRPTAGWMPQVGEVVLDTIPVDYVARAIHWSSFAPEANGKLLHLCSGPEIAWTLQRLIGTIRESYTKRGEVLPTLKTMPLGVFETAMPVLKLLSNEKGRKKLRNLEMFLEFARDSQTFDNRHTITLLSKAGITIPSVESYFETVMGYYWQHGKKVRGNA